MMITQKHIFIAKLRDKRNREISYKLFNNKDRIKKYAKSEYQFYKILAVYKIPSKVLTRFA